MDFKKILPAAIPLLWLVCACLWAAEPVEGDYVIYHKRTVDAGHIPASAGMDNANILFTVFSRADGSPSYMVRQTEPGSMELVFLDAEGNVSKEVNKERGTARPSANGEFVAYYHCSRPPCEEFEDPHFGNRSMIVFDRNGNETLVLNGLPTLDFLVSNTGRYVAGALTDGKTNGPELYLYSQDGILVEHRIGRGVDCVFSRNDKLLACEVEEGIDGGQPTLYLFSVASGTLLWSKGAERLGLIWIDAAERTLAVPVYIDFDPAADNYRGFIAAFDLDGKNVGAYQFTGSEALALESDQGGDRLVATFAAMGDGGGFPWAAALNPPAMDMEASVKMDRQVIPAGAAMGGFGPMLVILAHSVGDDDPASMEIELFYNGLSRARIQVDQDCPAPAYGDGNRDWRPIYFVSDLPGVFRVECADKLLEYGIDKLNL